MPANYIVRALKSRGYDPDRFHGCKCERCEYQYFHPKQFPRFAQLFTLYASIPKYQEVHHIDGRGGKRNTDNRLNDPRGLILLCKHCHAQLIHGRDRQDEHKRIALYKINLSNGSLTSEQKQLFSKGYNRHHNKRNANTSGICDNSEDGRR
jgi:hypothetical protein